MAATLTFRALVWAALLAFLVPYCSAFRYSQSRYGDVSASDEQDIYSAEAEAMIKHDKSEEGEDHGDIGVPDGAEFTSFNVNEKGDEEIAGFISKDLDEKTIEHLFIVLHGRLRDGNGYWKTLNNAINKARDDNFPGTDRKMAVLSPQFFSTKFNSGQYKKNQLAWDDLNAWQPGAQANHPANTSLTSLDVLDGLVKLHSDKEKYPNLKNVTVVGHGGGGQLAQRYSALGNDPPDNVHVRYIHGDPSSCMYFTEDRPILQDTETSRNSCDSYNIWRYGFDKFPGTGGKRMTPKEYFTQYVSRDIVSIVGLQDTGSAGDTSCMGNVQGGKNRRTRNLIWFRYINTLARTDEDLEGFPGSFKDLPDWSDAVDGKSHLRLVVVEDVAHNAEKLFQGDLGRGALFHDGNIDEGWRPKKDNKN
ncbi:uncharacterized protein ASPGLDRAFT_62845 [Aspergillus glaucus CBS 516.65]|uniref:Transmembrane protein n=1 Tax=Aspergillus glaucus CBS 516.65 TaxID=1160497 RepID=A0A1L9VZK9_ASPGL|nr:hypothetical protein ASPGLDRAFT_62845 [Aspergillus glaucus CBS 516.65]OJJ89319.1 hypothetical protein ASPGLDRAFT_62845 [Aspergillus glaucus CBS 516.65]